MTGDWTLGAASFPSTLSRGVINLSGGGTDLTAGRIKGSGVLTVDGDINVTAGFGLLEPDVIFNSGAAVVVSSGATLELKGTATFNGGSYTGQGILFQVGDGTFAADTTIDTRVYNWDGIEFTTTTVKPGVTLTINSDLIDTFGGFEGTATVNSGTLAVNTVAAWR